MRFYVLALALSLGSGARAAERTCIVEGAAVDPLVVDVTPKEGPALRLRVEHVAASVQPGPVGAPARVKVRGSLTFEGTAPADRVPYKTRRVVDATSGMVRLASGTEGLTLRAHFRPKWVEADVTLGPVVLRGLLLPCDALTLDAQPPVEMHAPEGPAGEVWVAAGRELHLRAGPGSGESLEVRLDGDGAALDLHRLEAAGAWMRVTSQWADGTTLVGWAKRAELKRAPERQGGLDELPRAPTTCARTLAPRPGTTVAPAAVAVGTLVYAARYLGPWATVSVGEALTVRYGAKDDWVELVGAPGIASAGECQESTVLDGAWIPRTAVQLPGAPDGGAR
jgi:hypothetical protein